MGLSVIRRALLAPLFVSLTTSLALGATATDTKLQQIEPSRQGQAVTLKARVEAFGVVAQTGEVIFSKIVDFLGGST